MTVQRPAASPLTADTPLDRQPLAPDPRPGLYVHVPFCARICPYCDFSVVGARHPGRVDYVDVIVREAEWWSHRSFDPPHAKNDARSLWSERAPFGTVYLGGGTPSVLDARERMRLIRGLHDALPIAPDAVWTMEANPEHVDADFARQLLEAGVDHVSLGVQSLDGSQLEELGRRHRGEDAERAVSELRAAGAAWISVDLIYAVNSDLEEWSRQLALAEATEPEHISCYELTIHQGTRFGREVAAGTRRVVDEDLRFRMFETALEHLSAGGYRAYEVSNFARGPAQRSPHNQKYWTEVPYLGLGPSAHSFCGGHRWWNRRTLRDWRHQVKEDGHGVEEVESLSRRERLLERLMMGLRTAAGLDLARISNDLGVDLRRVAGASIEDHVAAGRLQWGRGGARLVPTIAGLAMADRLVLDLLPEMNG